MTELSCEVEYGPVVGVYERRLRRLLMTIVEMIRAAADVDAKDGKVFAFRRRELSPEEAAAQVTNVHLSLAARKRIEKALA